jgi:ABC-type transporter Mla subunit MlaD
MAPAVWLSVILFLSALTFGGVRIFRSGRLLWRDLRSLLSALDGTLVHLTASADTLAERTARFEDSASRLEAALTRFAASRARLEVLAAAVNDVEGSVARVAAYYPRK